MKISPVKNSKFIYVSQNFQYHFSTMLKLEKFSKRLLDILINKEMIKQRLKYPKVQIDDEFIIMQTYLETEKSGFYVRDMYGNEYENAFEIPLKVGLDYENIKKAKN